MKPIRQLLKYVLRRGGFELRRYSVQNSCHAQLILALEHLGIHLVLDVGANAGQYGSLLRGHGYRGRIVSFEPLASAYAKLGEVAKSDTTWWVAPRMALGASEGEVDLNISANSQSSSILAMLPLHEEGAPGSGVIGRERVLLSRLDRVAASFLRGSENVLLKIDTQGYEEQVLAGAHGILNRICAIQTEMSFVPLYAGQPLFDEMRQLLDKLGYELFALFPGYVHEVTGQTLQVDGLFVRKGASAP
jgi:FkbM family methyltransferase